MTARPLVPAAMLGFVLGLAAPHAPAAIAQLAPPPAQTVADQAFYHLTQGLASGQWEPFFNQLADDITFSFPMGKYVGSHQGKDKAIEFFRYVSTAFPQGLTVTEVLRRTRSDSTFVYEFRDEGSLRGAPYKNRVAISLDVCGTRICGYREYFGSDGKTNAP